MKILITFFLRAIDDDAPVVANCLARMLYEIQADIHTPYAELQFTANGTSGSEFTGGTFEQSNEQCKLKKIMHWVGVNHGGYVT